MESLKISQLGPIDEVDIKIGDITMLVGPQASGKTLFLQVLNLLLDYPAITGTLRTYGFTIDNVNNLLGHYLGFDMAKAWKNTTKILKDGVHFDIERIMRARPRQFGKKVFYIPAQRVIIMEEGWPRPFLSLISYPYVVRDFSEGIRVEMEQGSGREKFLFPQENRLQKVIREKIQQSIYKNTTIKLETKIKKRLVLEVNGNQDMQLPISFWSAGQREFMPFLLGLYYLCPPARVSRKGDIETVIIEELEMGLHPEAINGVMLSIMELINRGYKVVISTHSLHVVEMIWALEEVKKSRVNKSDKLRAFNKLFKVDNNTPGVRQIAESSLEKEYKVFYFKPEEKSGLTVSLDITGLEISEPDPLITGWGGLAEFSTSVVDVVADVQDIESV
jgi:predicted ATPase